MAGALVRLLAPLLAFPAAVFAAEPGATCVDPARPSPQLICGGGTVADCKDPGMPDRLQATLCADGELARADEKLNATYKEIIQRLDTPGGRQTRARLVGAQRAWLRFRDAECETVRELHSGGWTDVFFMACATELTSERVKSLERRFLHGR